MALEAQKIITIEPFTENTFSVPISQVVIHKLQLAYELLPVD